MNTPRGEEAAGTPGRPWTGQVMGTRLGHFSFSIVIRLFGRRFATGILVAVSLFYFAFRPKVFRSALPYLRRRFPQSGRIALAWHGWRLVFSFSEVILDRL